MKLSLCTMFTFAALGLAGTVAGGTATAAPDLRPTPAPLSDEAPKTPHGIVQMIGEALSEVSLTDEQQATVDGLADIVVPLQGAVDQAESDLLATLADQVRAGELDREALAPKVDAYAAARQAFRGPFESALESLHDLLDASQRDDFADALACRVHDAFGTETSQERLDAFESALDLDDAQKEEVSADVYKLFPVIEAERHNVHLAIEGFRSDTFSLEDYFPAIDVAARARRRAERIIDVTDEILGILDADQAGKLAARIDAAAAARAEPTPPPSTASGPEHVGAAQQHIWAVGRRGPWGGGVVVGGSARWFGARVGAYPIAAGWGMGW